MFGYQIASEPSVKALAVSRKLRTLGSHDRSWIGFAESRTLPLTSNVRHLMRTLPPENGPYLTINLFGVPTHIHWSFFAVGVSVGATCALLAQDQAFPVFILSSLACAGVVTLHEVGHAVAALAISRKVHAIVLARAGGWCFTDAPEHPVEKIILSSAGILAQALLFLSTVLVLLVVGAPSSLPATCAVVIFTGGNVVIAAPNLIPKNNNDAAQVKDAVLEIFSRSKRASDA